MHDLEKENRKLRSELERYRRADELRKTILVRLFRWFIGKDVDEAARTISEKWGSDKPAKREDYLNLSVALFKRIVRVGLVPFALAAIPSALLVWQNILIMEQNRFLRTANRFNIESAIHTPRVDVSINGWICTVINADTHPIYDVGVYSEIMIYDRTKRELIGKTEANTMVELPRKRALAIQPLESLTMETDFTNRDNSCSGGAYQKCREEGACGVLLGCVVRYHRHGDRKMYSARQFALSEAGKECKFEQIDRTFSIEKEEANEILEVARKRIGTPENVCGSPLFSETEISELECN